MQGVRRTHLGQRRGGQTYVAESAAGGGVGRRGCKVARCRKSSPEPDGVLLLPHGPPQEPFNAAEERVDRSLVERGDLTASKGN
jgi:hypothetical protein